MADKTLTATETHQVAVILGQIANMAHSAERQCYYSGYGDDKEEAEVLIDNLRRTIQHMGLLADMGVSKTDRDLYGARGSKAEDWLLPPSYRDQRGEV